MWRLVPLVGFDLSVISALFDAAYENTLTNFGTG